MIDGHADFSAIDGLFAELHAASPSPALAYGIVADGRLVHSGGFGALTAAGPSPNADSVFRIASMTKSFTATCLLGLRDAGALALDDPVRRWVPELAALAGPTTDSPTITLRDLLTMSAGLPTDDPWGDRQLCLSHDGFTAVLRSGFRFAWVPGMAFEYSNLSYAIIGRVIAAAAGQEYRRVVESMILRPLQLESTVFEAHEVRPEDLAVGHRDIDGRWIELPFTPHGEFAPMGGLFSSVRGLARWIAEFTDAFPPRDGEQGHHVLSRASRREMQRVQRLILPSPPLPWADGPAPAAAGYGFGLFVEHDPAKGTIVSHPGGLPGFGSGMSWNPESGLGVVVLANATYAPAPAMATRALQALLAPAASAGTVAPWPETEEARMNVLRLIECWDPDLAARVFAQNVDLDEPLTRRRADIERLKERAGVLHPDPDSAVDVVSPASAVWLMRGERGRVRVRISLTPQRPPAIQTLELTLVPDETGGRHEGP